jgi:hypothetical protein
MGLDSEVVEHETDYTCVPVAPAPPPAQYSGAEGLPPLPLPVVPLRRTEKKNPPRPPVLVAKIATSDPSDWATNPGDVENLLRWMAANLNVHFSSINLPEDQVPDSAVAVPVLYRTGHNAFSFPPAVRTRLRAYLLEGGTLVLDACCGRRAFVESALREISTLLPERAPYRLDQDHPLYRSYFPMDDIRYRPWARKAGARNGEPGCIGVDIGCRTAIFLFRWDVSCGWDGLADSDDHHCLGYEIETARRLGANLLSYITAEHSAAVPLSNALEFVDAEPRRTGRMVMAQVAYNGQWRTREAGLSMLLDTCNRQTRAPVRFEPAAVRLDSADVFGYPFLYMTGHQDFTLSSAERNGLREYLARGGLLLGEACCGRAGFDRAFRRELARSLGGAGLERIPPAHILFQVPNRIERVQPRAALARDLGQSGGIPPELYGISIEGRLGVIYSPHGLACGWELAPCPYCRGVLPEDALRLGVNILSYAVLN